MEKHIYHEQTVLFRLLWFFHFMLIFAFLGLVLREVL